MSLRAHHLALALLLGCGGRLADDSDPPSAVGASAAAAKALDLKRLDVTDARGTTRTISTNAKLDVETEPFFVSFGTNGRTCVHCHVPADAWTLSPESLRFRWTHPLDPTDAACVRDPKKCAEVPEALYGTDPVFRPVDGAVSPSADVSTPAARASAYALLLSKGLVRVGLGIPSGADFELVAVSDPYLHASAAELSLFRRPLPATNLHTGPDAPGAGGVVLSSVMWDGRETLPGHDLVFDLMDQANGATLGHAQATSGLSLADRQAIVAFETGLLTARVADVSAGNLAANGARGGPEALGAQAFYPGINDVLAGDAVTGAPFDPNAMTMFTAWKDATVDKRASIARGEALFDTKPITITDVSGLNDDFGLPVVNGTCTTCHDTPSFGHHSVRLPIDIGIASAARRTPDLPLYTLREKGTGRTVQTTDPGRALVTGRFRDVGRFKGPVLRGLASRAPYFHNGSAATLSDVVAFYEERFGVAFTAQEEADLVAFLGAL